MTLNVLQVLVDNFQTKPISAAEEHIKPILTTQAVAALSRAQNAAAGKSPAVWTPQLR